MERSDGTLNDQRSDTSVVRGQVIPLVPTQNKNAFLPLYPPRSLRIDVTLWGPSPLRDWRSVVLPSCQLVRITPFASEP